MNDAFRRLMVWGMVIVALVVVGALFSKLYYDISLDGGNPFRRAAPVRMGGVMRLQTSEARLVAAQRAELAFSVSGQLVALNVEVGQQVAAGEELARLNDTKQRLAVAKALENLTAAELSGVGIRIEQAELELAAAQAELEATVLKAPFAGQVMAVSAVSGQAVSPGSRVVTLAQTQPPLVQAQISQNSLRHVAIGQAVQVTLDAYPGRTFSGRVIRIGHEASEALKGATIEVWMELRNDTATSTVATPGLDDLQLLPGLTANAEILVPRRQGTLDIASWFIALLLVLMLIATYLLSKILTPEVESSPDTEPAGRGYGRGGGMGWHGGGRW
jgi:multidrug efflux pump subunit AcrA (membrane-fusion protein)